MDTHEHPAGWEALAQLAPVHSLALRLRAAGLPVELTAECLGVEPEAVAPLLAVAEAKLAAVLDRQPPPEGSAPAAGAPRGQGDRSGLPEAPHPGRDRQMPGRGPDE